MALQNLSEALKHGPDGLENGNTGIDDLKGVLKQLRGLKTAVVSGAAAGNVTVTGIKAEDHLVSVLHENSSGVTVENLVDEFSITADDTINNTGGTSSASGKLIVQYYDLSAGA